VHRTSPLLGAAFGGLLQARGLALIDVYERGHDLDDVYQVAEQMLTWDERAILWRFQHLKTVERIIGGNVIGTQGTPVDVLGKRIDVRFFSELWLVRDEITRRSALGTDGHGR
jgi:tryptophan 2,3-dioxygenase